MNMVCDARESGARGSFTIAKSTIPAVGAGVFLAALGSIGPNGPADSWFAVKETAKAFAVVASARSGQVIARDFIQYKEGTYTKAVKVVSGVVGTVLATSIIGVQAQTALKVTFGAFLIGAGLYKLFSRKRVDPAKLTDE